MGEGLSGVETKEKKRNAHAVLKSGSRKDSFLWQLYFCGFLTTVLFNLIVNEGRRCTAMNASTWSELQLSLLLPLSQWIFIGLNC